MTLSTVTNLSLISAATYNNIHDRLEQVIEDYWGGQTRSLTVEPGFLIDQRYWDEIADDVARSLAHIANVDFTNIVGPEVNTGTLIVRNFLNHVITATNYIYANTTTVHPDQLAKANTLTGAAESIRIQDFGSTVTHRVSYNFTSTLEAQTFFNLGGFLCIDVDYGPADFVPIISTDTNWIEMITWLKNEYKKPDNQFTLTNYINSTSIILSTLTNVDIGGVLYPYYTLDSSIEKIDSETVRYEVVFGQIGYMSDLDLYSTATFYYSRGDAPLRGFESPKPLLTNDVDLGTGGALVAFPTKYLDYTTFASNFTWSGDVYSPKESAQQSITLTNAGNRSFIIYNIIYSTHGEVTPIVSYSSTPTFPLTMTPGQTLTINVKYKGLQVGTHNNTVVVVTDAYFGNKTIPTTQIITPPQFAVELTPTSLAVGSSNIYQISNLFFSTFREYGVKTSSAVITGDEGFTFPDGSRSKNWTDSLALGPNQTYINSVYWEPFDRDSGTYTGSLAISITGQNDQVVSFTVPLLISYSEPTITHLGGWNSPQAKYNAVIGISYDIIDTVRYVTIGIGMGSDDAPTVQNGGSNYASYDNLGRFADYKQNQGPVVYYDGSMPSSSDPSTQFWRLFNSWINESYKYPVDTAISRTYGFNMPVAGSATVEFILKHEGWIAIDGNKIADYAAESQINYEQSYWDADWGYTVTQTYLYPKRTASIYLSAGNHTVSWNCTIKSSFNENGGVAIRITDDATGGYLWTSIVPARPYYYPAYPYYKSAYRIPLDGTARYYYAGNYMYKDPQTYNGNLKLSDMMGNTKVVTVYDDGYGNLSFTFEGRTLEANNEEDFYTTTNLPYLHYYYTPFGDRVVNLDSGANGQTNYFVGFDRFGNVRTTLVPIPASPNYQFYAPESSSSDENLIGLALIIGGIAVGGGGGAILAGLGILAIFKIICTKMYRLGLIPKDIFEADQKFGKYLIENDPDVYTGYIGWAEIMVNWMDGRGKGPNLWKLLFWIKDEEQQIERWKDWIIKFTVYGGVPWAEEMARRMGVRETSPLAGKWMMFIGLPICRTIGKVRRKFGQPKREPGKIKGLTLLTTLCIIYIGVAISKLIDKIKK